jgi:hypothetical protein
MPWINGINATFGRCIPAFQPPDFIAIPLPSASNSAFFAHANPGALRASRLH